MREYERYVKLRARWNVLPAINTGPEGLSCGETDKIHLRSRNMSEISHVGRPTTVEPSLLLVYLLRLLNIRCKADLATVLV